MSGSGRDDLPDVREWSVEPPDFREWTGGPLGCPGVVGRPSRMSRGGRESLPNGWEWTGVPPECPGVVRRPSRMSGSGREALPDVREWSTDHSRMSGSG